MKGEHYSKTKAKPWRTRKSPEKMKGGKLARARGKAHQKRVAEFLEGIDRWPLQIGDVMRGEYLIQAKTLEGAFPNMVETLLEEAEIEARKLNPDLIGILEIHKSASRRRVANDLLIMRLDTFKEMIKCEGDTKPEQPTSHRKTG